MHASNEIKDVSGISGNIFLVLDFTIFHAVRAQFPKKFLIKNAGKDDEESNITCTCRKFVHFIVRQNLFLNGKNRSESVSSSVTTTAPLSYYLKCLSSTVNPLLAFHHVEMIQVLPVGNMIDTLKTTLSNDISMSKSILVTMKPIKGFSSLLHLKYFVGFSHDLLSS